MNELKFSGQKPFKFWCQHVLPAVYDESLSYYELLSKVVNYINNLVTDVSTLASAFTDLQNYVDDYFTSTDFQQLVNDKLDEMSTNGTLTSIISTWLSDFKGYVSPEMFGAKGNGSDNDWSAFAQCAAYANANNLTIFVPRKQYYINNPAVSGERHPIILRTNVECDNSVFIVGPNHNTKGRAVFKYEHDSDVTVGAVRLSYVLTDNSTVTPAYKNKFFVISTNMNYGVPVSGSIETIEYVEEPCVSNGLETKIYFDDVSSHLDKIISTKHASDIGEQGYHFCGAYVKQYDEQNYGIYFVNINRNNMTFSDIQIECNNTEGHGTVLYAEYCANLTFQNIKSYSQQPNVWGYEISCYYCANLLVDNFKGFNYWSSITTRGMKNYTLVNSITNTFDCHWNAFGTFICENNELSKDAHIGYGNGTFIVKNTTCRAVAVRRDFEQVWHGDIIVEDVSTINGFMLEIPNVNVNNNTYDEFFNIYRLPNISIDGIKANFRSLYIYIPNEGTYTSDGNTVDRINEQKYFRLKNSELVNIHVNSSTIAYKAILNGVPFVSGGRSEIKKACDVVYDDNGRNVTQIANALLESISGDFNDIDAQITRQGNLYFINFSGTVATTFPSWTKLMQLSVPFRPAESFYTVGCYNDMGVTIQISADGKVVCNKPLDTANKRLTFTACYIKVSQY